MADNTKIEWTDATWNPITGCSIVSPGCTNCYAMKLAGTRMKNHPSRAGLTKDSKAGPVWTGEVRFNAQWLAEPLKWKRPRMIFVCAHGDLFAEGVPDEWIDQIFAVMALAPHHTFQVLTKRPERMRDYFHDIDARSEAINRQMNDIAPQHWCKRELEDYSPEGLPLPNVWLGVSVEDQPRAEQRIPILLETPAAVRWISAEPLLGALDIRRFMWPVHPQWPGKYNTPADAKADGATVTYHRQALVSARSVFLDWVVAGGESGRNARPMHPDWARSLRDQCAAAGVPFLFKQWGEWWEVDSDARDENGNHRVIETDSHEAIELWDAKTDCLLTKDAARYTPDTLPENTPARLMTRLGKKAAGRMLDGIEHNGFPEVRS
ncbi:hypothetical protein RvVAR031_36370 [Agrobacterium vitis]|uniref:DUF5131 family protein n=1 Tax=Agrobacterium vitis TaxID=373 RepID=UPI0015DB769D|nr:phage Gp37/Gp68 family protein [Agrobacterium vitis]BCH56027.1 hypothetical protein RvVAR031_36370 [Agrobacterium vitis]